MAVLNVLVIALTLGVKAGRAVHKRRTKARTQTLEFFLGESLATGEIHPALLRLGNRDLDLLAILMVQYLALLRGAERERLVRLAEQAGLLERYLGRLQARGRWRKARAAENLGYFGGPGAVAPIAQLLEDRDETVRAIAARALARIGTPEAAEILATTLDDPSELTRLRVAENLERIGSPALKPLIAALERARGTQEHRLLHGATQAAQVLARLRAPEARPVLGDAALGGDSVDLRAAATFALGKIGNPDDIDKLLAAAGDDGWPVRAQAASSLGMIGDISTIPTLERLTLDEEWWVRLNASRALANMGPAGERALARLLESEDRFARDRAAATLEERGITRQVVTELTAPGERGESARAMIRAMVRAGAVRYLQFLARTLPDESARAALRQTMVEAREP